MGDLSRTVSESLGDFLRKWGIPAIPRPRINTGTVCKYIKHALTETSTWYTDTRTNRQTG